MFLRSPTLATTSTTIMIYLIILTSFCHSAVAAQRSHDLRQTTSLPGNETLAEQLICKPFGVCEPCPADSLNEPFCQPFGNRRLMHCMNITATDGPSKTPSHQGTSSSHSSADIPPTAAIFDEESGQHPEGETLAWEACGRIVRQERADFYEFVAVNVLFTVISLAVLFVRSRRQQALQTRQLAARIGLVRSGGVGRR